MVKFYKTSATACWVVALILFAGACGSSRPTATTASTTADTTRAKLPPPQVPATVPLTSVATPTSAGLDTAKAGKFDNGKMWTFDHPPVDYLKETYGFAPEESWYEHARLGALRIPGCSASFVSANGLVMTNHHCARGSVAQVTRPGEKLLETGFYAQRLEDERPIEKMWADRLIKITDVTSEVYAALEGKQTDAERAQARQDAIKSITDRLTQEAGGKEKGMMVQVISLYNGGQYSAYTFRHYDDVRLVMAPELQMAHFGGEYDNFTYPRYALDMSFFRVYENGKPLETDQYFKWSENGAQEGELTFVIGNPGSTNRIETVAQLEFRRDVQEKNLLALIESRVAALQAYYDKNPSDQLLTQIYSYMNGLKLYRGRVKGLNDPVLMARRRDAERQFLDDIQKDEKMRTEYSGLVDRMADLQKQKREFTAEYGAFLSMAPQSGLESSTMRKALLAHTYLTQKQAGATAEALAPIAEQIAGVEAQQPEVDRRFLALRFKDFVTYFGQDHEIVRGVLKGRTPEEAADAILSSTVLTDSAKTAQALQNGTLTMEDPALAAVSVFAQRYKDYQSAMAGLMAQQQETASKLGRAHFDISGTAVPPDATFSLRIADGVVKGYPYNGTVAPSHTTMYGIFERNATFPDKEEWKLPERWTDLAEELDLSTPMNLVTTADIIGGNSGSPMINKNHEIVGLVFDGNIESLPSSFIYRTENFRCVAVDSRGMMEALQKVYKADRMVAELKAGQLVSVGQ